MPSLNIFLQKLELMTSSTVLNAEFRLTFSPDHNFSLEKLTEVIFSMKTTFRQEMQLTKTASDVGDDLGLYLQWIEKQGIF